MKFDSRRRHNQGCFIARGSEVHAFEKILRCLLFAGSMPKDNPDTKIVAKKALKFMEWITQYFTLLFICKDGHLTETNEEEVTPLKFLDTIFAFHLYFLRHGSVSSSQSSCFDGANICLEQCVNLLVKLFEGRPEVLSNLEIVSILIKRICHISYDQDLRKKLAITFALPTVLNHFPLQAISMHAEKILEALCHNINSNYENLNLIPSAQQSFKDTIDLLF
jgi:hypothetical protein